MIKKGSPAERWPRWLPAPYLRDQCTHYVQCRGERGACGAETMWAEPGHATTERPRCRECVHLSESGAKSYRLQSMQR
jgi:hypothetical protein